MTDRFQNKTALVTGAASGIGTATVKRLLSEGANVMAADVAEARLQTLADELNTNRFCTFPCDVTNRQATEQCVAATVDKFGKLDVLINSAGITTRDIAAELDFEEAWDKVMAINVKGSMLMCHAAVPAMLNNNPSSGSIVNLGSIMSFAVAPPELNLSDGYNAYPHSKGAVIQLTRDVAVRFAENGIRANAVCPGFIDTALTSVLKETPERYSALQKRHPLGRFGTAEEVANVIVFLASDEASFVTGETWRVDGGYLAT